MTRKLALAVAEFWPVSGDEWTLRFQTLLGARRGGLCSDFGCDELLAGVSTKRCGSPYVAEGSRTRSSGLHDVQRGRGLEVLFPFIF